MTLSVVQDGHFAMYLIRQVRNNSDESNFCITTYKKKNLLLQFIITIAVSFTQNVYLLCCHEPAKSSLDFSYTVRKEIWISPENKELYPKFWT